MERFYFTYGTSGYPFCGGWTVVKAESMEMACSLFRAHHPDKIPGLLNCADYYTEEQFLETEMSAKGNFGEFCHEMICCTRTLTNQKGESGNA